MPWDIQSAGNGKYNVRSQKSGKVVGHNLSKKRAKAMMRALYANVPDATTNANGYPKGVNMKVAKKVDLIVLPVSGTNCGNCKFVDKGKDGMYCDNPKVKQPVTAHLCCALWDNDGVKRPWGKEAVTVNEKQRRIQTRKKFVKQLLAAGHPPEDCEALQNMSLNALALMLQSYKAAGARSHG